MVLASTCQGAFFFLCVLGWKVNGRDGMKTQVRSSSHRMSLAMLGLPTGSRENTQQQQTEESGDDGVQREDAEHCNGYFQHESVSVCILRWKSGQ